MSTTKLNIHEKYYTTYFKSVVYLLWSVCVERMIERLYISFGNQYRGSQNVQLVRGSELVRWPEVHN